MIVTNDIKYIGVNDHKIDLFEGQYPVPNGMSYNSYAIIDEKIAIMDSVEEGFIEEWLENIEAALEGRKPDYLVVQHMEPDHSGNIMNFANAYPESVIVSSSKAFAMMKNFFGTAFEDRRIVVGENSALSLGKHTLTFVTAPLVHWPEVIMTYDSTDKVLFAADGFGKFGAVDVDEPWLDEARRYYIGIVGKFGVQVQNVLKKARGLDIDIICSLHGPVLKGNIGYFVDVYDTWSSYRPEEEGVVIAYTSVYGNTEKAVRLLADKLHENGCPKVVVHDLARCDMAEAVADAFRYTKLVLATTTYNTEIFPPMREYINDLVEHNFSNRTVGLIENGTWAPVAARHMMSRLEKCKNLTFADNTVTILSALNDESKSKLFALADELCGTAAGQDGESCPVCDLAEIFSFGDGLYVVTTNDGEKDNGLIVDGVSVAPGTTDKVTVKINKKNYSHEIIKNTGIMNLNCLSVDAPFSVVEKYGFVSGRNTDKFAGEKVERSENGLVILPGYINAYMSLKVEEYSDTNTHGLFTCSVTELKVLSYKETMTYSDLLG